MEVTHRYWAGVALASLLAGGAWLLDRPLLLAGGAGIGAFLLVQQYRFLRAVLETTDDLTLTQTVSHDRVATDESVRVVVRATLSDPAPVEMTIEAQPPVSATVGDGDHRVECSRGSRAATATFSLRWSVAGRFELGNPQVTLIGPVGFFRSTVPHGPNATVTVVPRRPRKLHVGAGGDRLPMAFGEHKTGYRGVGLDLADIREYVPGDTARQIDWKATARTGSPHVREFDAETDLSTILVLDHRSSLATGRPGEQKLDYIRQVALAYTDHARSNTEPLALYCVGDKGVTTHLQSDANMRHYTRVETRLHDLAPTSSPEATPRPRHRRTPSEARESMARLRADGSSFGTTLRPYFRDAAGYRQHIEDDQLYNTVRTYLSGVRGSAVTALLTDDTHRTEVREAVRVAKRQSDHVLVFLAPSVLFERGGLRNVESAYERYVDFEEFRRTLMRIDGVSAFEVGPADRIEAILAGTRQTKRARER
ncbi:DUF58 domain-containing protein [Haladaptatus sp. DFWS20]|uniref:DUF58 domain-containing protein n=1 Tax=Haladaptatus sp. DFWS20 TaxID=3403467 RepID=UPI003EBBEEF7